MMGRLGAQRVIAEGIGLGKMTMVTVQRLPNYPLSFELQTGRCNREKNKMMPETSHLSQ